LLDCTYAAGILSLEETDDTFEKAPLPPDLPRVFQTRSSCVLVASSAGNEDSYIGTSHSCFTECLIEALSGNVMGKGGFVRILDVLSYLLDTVPQRTSNRQHPIV